MKIYKWGIIGPGRIANKFAQALPLAGNAVLEAVASRNGEHAREFAEKFGAARYYDNYEELAADPDIDAIYISTPHAFHRDQALLCMHSGKPVLCEKPLALSARQAQQMIEASTKRHVLLMEAMWSRFLPMTNKILELISEGKLGTVKYVRADFSFVGPEDPYNRLYNLNLGGGSLLDVGVYPLSLCLLLLGRPDEIKATGHLTDTGADESAHALLQYNNGSTASIRSGIACQTSITAEIAGTKGLITIPAPWYKNNQFQLTLPGQEPQTIAVEPFVNGFEYEIREVQRCIGDGLIESPSMSHAFSLMLSQTMDAIRAQLGVVYPEE